jgi:hypothetical protein
VVSGGVSCCLTLLACSGGGGAGEGGVSGGEVAESSELPAGDDESGVLLVCRQLAEVFGGLALPVGAAFTPDGAQGGGVAATFRSEVSATPQRR